MPDNYGSCRRRLSLDDAVDRHLPQVPRKWRGITIRQLLNHTSGVPDFTDTGSRHWSKTFTPEGLLELVGDEGLRFKPGTKYEYSNSNYVMLGMLAEKFYGKPLAQILDEEIARPLGLTTLRYCEDAYGANGQARPYVREGARIEDAPYRSLSHGRLAGARRVGRHTERTTSHLRWQQTGSRHPWRLGKSENRSA